PIGNATLDLGGMLRHRWMGSGIACPSTSSTPRGRHHSRRSVPIGRPSFPSKTVRRDFGIITTWYLHSHRTWDRLCHSCMGSSFLAHGAFAEGGASVVSAGMHAGSLEALWVTRPEAVVLAGNKFFLWPSGLKDGPRGDMARRLRIPYPGAIYQVMARGNGRQDMVRDDDDRGRLQRELGRDAVRGAWRIYAFVILSNPIHLVLKTPQPNRARGMQVFLPPPPTPGRDDTAAAVTCSRVALAPRWWKTRPTSGR